MLGSRFLTGPEESLANLKALAEKSAATVNEAGRPG
jgi:hypothetical protein